MLPHRLIEAARLGLWAAAFGFGLLSLALARSQPAGSFAGRSWVAALATLAAGWGMIGAGLHVWLRRPAGRSGYLLAVAGIGWFFVEWSNPGVGNSAAFTFGLLTWALAPPLVAHAVVAYPFGSLRLLDRVALLSAYVGSGFVLGLLPALFFDPHRQACNLCPANLLAIQSNQEVVDAFNRWGVRLGLVWTIALAALAVLRLVRASPPMRRTVAPVLLGGVVYLALVWTDFAHSLPRGVLSNDPFEYRLWLGEAGALCAIALGVVWSWIRARRTRSVLARLVVELGESPPPGGLRHVLASALGDPQLEVAYPLGEPDRYVVASGVMVDPATWEGRTVTPLARGGTTVAVLIHRRGLLDDPGVSDDLVRAARIALENERLQAEIRAQLEDLRASRARIVATGDGERRRLERDLHDGAQQRLVGLALALRLARARIGPDPDPTVTSRLDQAEDGLRLAIDELRNVAHGIYPAVLGDEGLAAAVEALLHRTSVPIEIVAVPEERFPRHVEAAAYFLVAEAIGPIAALIGASAACVELTIDGDRLLVEVTEDGRGDTHPDVETRLTDLSDRVGALDGELKAEQVPGRGITIRAEIPCG